MKINYLFGYLFFVLVFLFLVGCTQTQVADEVCVKEGTDEKLSLAQAIQIAQASECLNQGQLEQTHFCNEVTGTWWIDLDIEKEGCAPACVIDVINKTAEINWRCTGLIS